MILTGDSLGNAFIWHAFHKKSFVPIVTQTEVRAALKATVGGGMTDTQLEVMAEYVLSFFGYETEVIDNRLDVDDRDVFYMLEEAGLVTTRQEEVFIKKGKLWRIHYWVLRSMKIKELAHNGRPQAVQEAFVYDQVPDEVWSSRQIEAK
jgi:hypothetical protein